MVKKLLVSIITPVKNGEKYLADNIMNVLEQPYPYVEHIFVDGVSTDKTLDILKRFQEMCPNKIRYISQPDNGVGDAVNKGFLLAQGDILGWIDSDDLYEPNAIGRVVEFFVENPNAHFVYGKCNVIDGEGKVIRPIPSKLFNFKESVGDKSPIVFNSAFFDRRIFNCILDGHSGLLNTLGNDLDLWLRIALHHRLHYLDSTLANWREHEGNISRRNDKRKETIIRARLREDYMLTRKYQASLFCPRAIRFYRYCVLDTLHLYPFIFWVEKLISKPRKRNEK